MTTTITMPEMGEGVIEGRIITWLKHEGDTIKEDDPVLEVETDKVTVEINAEDSGTLLKIHVNEGDTVAVGSVLATLGEPGEAVSDAPEIVESPVEMPVQEAENVAPKREVAVSQAVNASVSAPTPREVEGIRLSPVVARMVQEHDLDVTKITGTGRGGRITKKDVQNYLENAPEDAPQPSNGNVTSQPTVVPVQVIPAAPVVNGAHDAETIDGELMPLTGMRRSIAEHMVRSKRESPHVTTVFEFDFSTVAKHRAEYKPQFAQDGIKLTYLPYLAMATVEALKAHPLVNASWTDDGILLKKDIHLGIAVAVPQGLMVPVIKHAADMNLRGLARAINDVSERGRTGKLMPNDLKGGTFTITNHGVSGSLIGTPIINQPQVGILGVGMIEKRVKVVNDAIAIRPCAYVSFSFDHRILDGVTADNFVMAIKDRVENFA